MFKRYLATLTIALVALCTGCSTLQDNGAEGIAVRYGIMKLVTETSITATEITAHTTRLRQIVEGDSFILVTELEQELRSHINWNRLDAADTFLLNEIITAVAQQIAARVDIDADRAVRITQFLDWVDAAARNYG